MTLQRLHLHWYPSVRPEALQASSDASVVADLNPPRQAGNGPMHHPA
jgi:hypothetical protein